MITDQSSPLTFEGSCGVVSAAMGYQSGIEENPLATGAVDSPTLTPIPSPSAVCVVCPVKIC